FINENNRRLMFGCLLEKLANTLGPYAHKHLGEIAAMSAEETGVCLASDGLGKHGLACSGRPDQQDSLGQITPHALVLLGIFEKIDNFLNFAFGFFDAGDVTKADAGSLTDTSVFALADVCLVDHQHDHQAGYEQGGNNIDPLATDTGTGH